MFFERVCLKWFLNEGMRAIEIMTSVYSLASEINRDIKEVHGTLGFD